MQTACMHIRAFVFFLSLSLSCTKRTLCGHSMVTMPFVNAFPKSHFDAPSCTNTGSSCRTHRTPIPALDDDDATHTARDNASTTTTSTTTARSCPITTCRDLSFPPNPHKIQQERESELFKIQQERESELFKIQQHREWRQKRGASCFYPRGVACTFHDAV